MRYSDDSRIGVGHRAIHNNQVGTVVVLIEAGFPDFNVKDWSGPRVRCTKEGVDITQLRWTPAQSRVAQPNR